MPVITGGIFALVAMSSVLAALLNQGLTVAKDWWVAKRDAAFSALYLAIALEAYASDCVSKIADSENHPEKEEGGTAMTEAAEPKAEKVGEEKQ